jgi:hypothetical protein
MPKPDTATQSSTVTSVDIPQPTKSTLCARADALFRSAAECCRQHARYARLVKHDAAEAEQRTACKVAKLYDELLEEMMSAYQKAAAHAPAGADEGWWHAANMLLHASREHLRHTHRCDRASRQLGSHGIAELDELATEYELRASALLALQRAAEGYRRVRPAAELKGGAGPAGSSQATEVESREVAGSRQSSTPGELANPSPA